MVPEGIIEKREETMEANNTAQARLADLLETANKTNKSLRITEKLHGDIDLSILKEQGAGNIRDIEFAEGGEITSIVGIPDSLERLSCPRNLLIELGHLPESLTHLEIDGNYLTDIDVSSLLELQVLNIAHNYLTHLSELPISLLEIECNNNKLTNIDLRGLDDLNRLIVSNNRITVIENLPGKIVDFQFDNNPTIEFRNSHSFTGTTGDDDEDEEEERKKTKKSKKSKPQKKAGSYTAPEAMREYFRLKQKYEESIKKGKKRIAKKLVSKSELTVQARAKIVKKGLQTFKPPCVKCGRPVGTIFAKKNHRFSAICGDIANACPLNIQIYVGDYTPVPYILYDLHKDYENLKEKIIRQKLDTLFNYIGEAESVAVFKEEVESFSTYNEMLVELTKKNDELYHNAEREHQIVEKEGDIFRMIERISTLLQEYRKESDPKMLEAIVRMQKDDLYPEIQNLRLLKTEIMEMNGKRLIKMPIVLSKMEHTFGEESRVISFVK